MLAPPVMSSPKPETVLQPARATKTANTKNFFMLCLSFLWLVLLPPYIRHKAKPIPIGRNIVWVLKAGFMGHVADVGIPEGNDISPRGQHAVKRLNCDDKFLTAF